MSGYIFLPGTHPLMPGGPSPVADETTEERLGAMRFKLVGRLGGLGITAPKMLTGPLAGAVYAESGNYHTKRQNDGIFGLMHVFARIDECLLLLRAKRDPAIKLIDVGEIYAEMMAAIERAEIH